MKEAWQDIINRKQKQEEPINPEQDSIWEEHISDEILYELPSQSMVYEFNENDDDATDSTSSDNITQLMTADETPQLSLLFSSSPPTVDEDIYLTLLDDDDDQDITFIQNDTCHFEDQILLKTSEEYFTHFNKTDCEALGKF
jgi:hypothetical protein